MQPEYDQCDACGHVRVRHHEACDVERCKCQSFAEPSGEIIMCGRGGASARWQSNRWGPLYGATWPDGFTRPRTCSYCGGVDPEGAILLIAEGWEVEETDKSYKRYLHPPGYHVATNALIAGIRDGVLDNPDEAAKLPRVTSPVPPVKLYVPHFNEDQIKRFNEAVRLHGATGEAN